MRAFDRHLGVFSVHSVIVDTEQSDDRGATGLCQRAGGDPVSVSGVAPGLSRGNVRRVWNASESWVVST